MTGQPNTGGPTRGLLLQRLPFRVLVALRAGVVVGTLIGLGAGLDQVLDNDYIGLGYWNSAVLVLALEVFVHLLVVVALALLTTVSLTFYDTFTRDPNRSAFVLVAVAGIGALVLLAVDIALRMENQGSVAHLLRMLRAAIETAPAPRIFSRVLLALAVVHLAGHVVHVLAARFGRMPPFDKFPKYYVTLRVARVVAWLAGGKTLTAAAVIVLLIGAVSQIPSRADVKPGPNVILISIDTLRADRLGCYGHDRNTSPRIDELAREAVVFEQAFSQAPWTLPSHASMLTSLRPSVHRADTYDSRLPGKLLTVPEVLRERGYRTMAITSHVLLTDLYGMEQGFARFRFNGERPAEDVTDLALEWVDGAPSKRPFFLMLHYFDVHADYDPPEEYRKRFVDPNYQGGVTGARSGFYANSRTAEDLDHLRDLYDAEIAYTDAHVGRLLDGLRERGLFKDALIILVSDHGEEFMEHGHFEHKTLHENVLRVPLIVKSPGREGAGRRTDQLVRLIDLAPTIFAHTGVPTATGGAAAMAMQGSDLTPFLSYGEASGAGSALAEQHPEVDPDGVRREAIRTPEYRYIRTTEGAQWLYDRRTDPDEMTDLHVSEPVISADFTDRLRGAQIADSEMSRRLLGTHAAKRDRIYLDEETRERLKALGYVQ